MENTKEQGYVSEKLLNAMISGTVPIYYGTDDVYNIFNREAFVHYDIENPLRAIQQVKELLLNEKKYDVMLSRPILSEGAFQKYFALYGKGEGSAMIREFIGISRHSPHADE